jgi:hypothetical protein
MISDAVPGLKAILRTLVLWRKDRRELRDQALVAIFEAASETKLYLEGLSSGRRRNREAETGLVRLWRRAAVPVSHLERDLADRCLLKSEYWISPEKWSRVKREQLRIGIEEVFDEARALLKG